MSNSIFWGNTDSYGASSIESEQLELFWGRVDYSCVEGLTGRYGGSGNTGADPLFANVANGDYHLTAGSAAIDAGDNAAGSTGVLTDLDGNPRYADDPATVDTGNGVAPVVDMGVYEVAGVSDPCLAPPPLAATPNPVDGDIEVVLSPALKWDGGPPRAPGCPTVYDVYFGTSNPPLSSIAMNLTAPTFNAGPLVEATTYYWRVVTRDCCTEVVGDVWSFTTAGMPLISANPASLEFDLLPGQTAVAQITLTNSGSAPTSWEATEQASQPAGQTVGAQPGASNPAAEGKPNRQPRPPVDWSVAHDPDTLIVGFRPVPGSHGKRSRTMRGGERKVSQKPLTMAQRVSIHSARGTTKLYSCKTIPVDVVRVTARADLQAIAAQYAAVPEVAYVEPNYIYETHAVPNDLRFGELWGMHNLGQTGGTLDADIDAPEAWDITTGSRNIIVGVIDTGVDYTHPELAANMWTNDAELYGVTGVDDDGNGIVDDIHGARWVSGNGTPTSGDPLDDHGHGTHVSGTIGARGDNNQGVAGVNWNIRIMGLKFLKPDGRGGASGTTADVISAIEYAVAEGAHLTSNSWGGGPYSQGLKDAIDAAGAAGQLFVAAAGNSNSNNDIYPAYPASYDSPTILSVAATDRNDLRAYFPGWWGSNWGATTVDLAAPGVDILSTLPGSAYASWSGTSMACPHVSGVAALLLGYYPSIRALDLKQIIMDSADPIASMAGMTVTGGRLNAFKALALADPATWMTFSPTAGVLWPGESAIINVAIDASRQTAGFVDAALIRVVSGDATGPLDIPVSLSVVPCSVDADCSDGVFCNGAETCGANGACLPAVPLDCDDGITCTVDACNEAAGSCDHVPSDAACDNGLPCDGVETCDTALDCQPGTPPVCDDGIPCTMDYCDNTVAGGCRFDPDDTLCDNGLPCDGTEFCSTTLGCQAGTPPVCDDGILCTTDSCNNLVVGGCEFIPDNVRCDNGVFCDGMEICAPGVGCIPGVDPCPGRFCDEAGSVCVDQCQDDTDCDDGVFCNGVEVCDAQGACLPGTPVDCDDGIACTVDACNEATASCDHVPSDAICDNGLFCDGIETCDPVLDCR
ncbi:MAG: S8 family serine peptidase, partial [Phycisphaerae bacterium]